MADSTGTTAPLLPRRRSRSNALFPRTSANSACLELRKEAGAAPALCWDPACCTALPAHAHLPCQFSHWVSRRWLFAEAEHAPPLPCSCGHKAQAGQPKHSGKQQAGAFHISMPLCRGLRGTLAPDLQRSSQCCVISLEVRPGLSTPRASGDAPLTSGPGLPC